MIHELRLRLRWWWGGSNLRHPIERTKRAYALLSWYWRSNDGDWSTVARLMQQQIRRLRLHIAEHGHHVGDDRAIRQMLIAETLLGRMLDDMVHYENADKRHPDQGSAWAKHVLACQKQDDEMLATILRKHLREWWC